MNGVVDPSDPLSREVGLEWNDDDENILFALTNLFDGFSCIGSPNITEIFDVEGNEYDNDCVILKRSFDQRNTLVLHDSESSESVSESSDSSKGYVESYVTVTVNSLSKFYIDLKGHSLYPFRFLIDGGSAVNALNKEMFLKISKQSPELKLNKNKIKLVPYGQAIPSIEQWDIFQYLYVMKIKK